MRLTLVAAMDNNRVIGKDNAMPWHLPADLAHFKKVTMGYPVVMGRKTHESIGRPLPGRENIILSRNPDIHIAGCTMIRSLDELEQREEELMIIGGGTLYRQLMPHAYRMILTIIDTELPGGDAWFPSWDEEEWEMVSDEIHPADEYNIYWLKFREYLRKTA